MSKVATKDEVLRSLTAQLRREGLSDELYIKLLSVYGKLQGWFPK
jgi:hypothetical protein